MATTHRPRQYGAMTKLKPTRRQVLAGIAMLAAATPARAQAVLDATTLGLVPDSDADQSVFLQNALDQAATAGQSLRLPRGTIHAQGLNFPGNLVVEGVPGSTVISAVSGGIVGTLAGRNALVLRDIGFAGSGSADEGPHLLSFENGDAITLERCAF